MLEAKERGLIDGDYKIEEASPCEIAARAGFGAVNRSGSAYQGSIDAVRASCVAGAKGREMRSEKLNQRNLGRVTLSLDDFTSSELREGIAQMAAQIGYEL